MINAPENDIKTQQDQIMIAVGECIMAWPMVERGITLVFCECMGGKFTGGDSWINAVIFDAVTNLHLRLRMLDAALEWKCKKIEQPEKTPPFLDEWKSLKKKIKKTYDKRHEIAHSDILQVNKDGHNVVSLAPFSVLSNAILGYDSIELQDIHALQKECNELSGKIREFSQKMLRVLAQPVKFPSQ